MKERRILLAAMRIIVEASKAATGEGLVCLFNAYNHLRSQVDGERLRLPTRPVPAFIYDTRLQMMRTQ